MRILQVCPRYPPQTGGVETHVREISERLVDRGHEVTVHTADASEGGRRQEQRNGVAVRRHRGLAPGGAFHVAPGIIPAVRRSDVDVVHAHNYHSLPMAFAAFGVSEQRFVVTPHYHGASASPFRDRLLAAYRPIGRRVLNLADAVIAVSEWERDSLNEDLGVEGIVIPNGVALERFSQAQPCERNRPYLFTVGRLERYKGIQHLIRSLSVTPDYDLVVAGDGPYRSALEQSAEDAGVADRVEFLGYVGEEKLPKLYAGASVFVTLSEFESYGLTVAEALASDTPCVVRRTGGLAHWGMEPGTVAIDSVKPGSVREAIRTAVGLSTTEAVVPSWGDIVDRIEGLYRG